LEFDTLPDEIKLGKDVDGLADVFWQPVAVVCKSGAQGGGHYWAWRRSNDHWYQVNDSAETMPVVADMGQVSRDINMIIMKKL
jgi:ubiquitin C-terminal hydrolase